MDPEGELYDPRLTLLSRNLPERAASHSHVGMLQLRPVAQVEELSAARLPDHAVLRDRDVEVLPAVTPTSGERERDAAELERLREPEGVLILTILESTYGPAHPNTKAMAQNVDSIRLAMQYGGEALLGFEAEAVHVGIVVNAVNATFGDGQPAEVHPGFHRPAAVV